MASEEEEYFLPLTDQRVFGAGIKRKRVPFIPAATVAPESSVHETMPVRNVGDRYLSIVLPRRERSRDRTPESPQSDVDTTGIQSRCLICNQPIPASLQSHEASIAHQLHLAHSQPPSHLDRQRMGVKYLSSYGWSPDARTGLGSREEGIRIPIEGKVKNDTTGLGVDLEGDGPARNMDGRRIREDKVVLQDAKQIRRQDAEARRKAEKMRSIFYGPDLSAYLGRNE